MAHSLSTYRRIVVKVGSALLVDEKGQLNRPWLEAFTHDIGVLAQQHELVIVSSGAVALGRDRLSIRGRKLTLEEFQAAAAYGQPRLFRTYAELMRDQGIDVGQILLALHDSDDRRRFINARNTLETLLKHHIIPIINENDTTGTSELRFGDNDRLAARVAQMLDADALILLSDIDGLYSAPPDTHPDAVHIPEVIEITPEIEAMAGVPVSNYGSGGMVTKVQAAIIATENGCDTLIAKGEAKHPLLQINMPETRYTCFRATAGHGNARKQWIAHTLQPGGSVTVDAGAERALRQSKSLLPVGITDVKGEFKRGDAVVILSANGQEIGKGLVEYDATETRQIAGRHSDELSGILHYPGRPALIHADDLVLY